MELGSECVLRLKYKNPLSVTFGGLSNNSVTIILCRATYFSPTPTDKMSAVVAAAKALYDQLNLMGEDSIDGDSFLDLWVYVCIKANIPDLVRCNKVW